MHDSYKIALINMNTAAYVTYDVHHISRLINDDENRPGICMFFDELEQIIEVLASKDYIVDDVISVVPENAEYYCIITADDGSNDWIDYIFDGIRQGYINVMEHEKDIVLKLTMSRN